ncbi:ribonuclease III [Clostridium sp. chh4-2]|uniref:Mini-ribonuclease 3 n=1 Tax=Clostridium sp. chh4-2 TaxID=2067550 RepID=UPI000CCDBEC0|nr:ribonuclease III domain-containing protein [Clostridium sp. chh4-2]PNV62685.1 ribonuclease III [Clostridium sp. chh4-2]
MEESITTQLSFIDHFKNSLKLGEVDVRTYSPLVLAYIGDAVYEVVIRTKVINHGSMQVNKMHKKSSSLVKAETQASLIKVLEEELTEEELAAFKRGRNAKSVSTAKNASVIDYRMATGFEALIGYLYLSEQYERMITLISHGLEKIGELE